MRKPQPIRVKMNDKLKSYKLTWTFKGITRSVTALDYSAKLALKGVRGSNKSAKLIKTK